MYEEITDKLSTLLKCPIDCSITDKKEDCSVIFKINTAEQYSISFHLLMDIAYVLGTTRFYINDEFIEGEVYSEVTRDSHTFLKYFVVKCNDINSGF